MSMESDIHCVIIGLDVLLNYFISHMAVILQYSLKPGRLLDYFILISKSGVPHVTFFVRYLVMFENKLLHIWKSVADPGFPGFEMTPTAKVGQQPIIWSKNSQKLHENERNWMWGARP